MALSLRTDSELLWKRLSWWEKTYSLWNREQEIARLDYHSTKESVAEIGANRWIFERAGTFTNEVSIIDTQTREEIAFVEMDWKGHYRLHLRYQPDVKLKFEHNNWGNKFYWSDETARKIIKYKRKGWLNQSFKMGIMPETVNYPYPFEMLMCLGLYLLCRKQNGHG